MDDLSLPKINSLNLQQAGSAAWVPSRQSGFAGILAALGGPRSGTMNARTLRSIHEGVSDLTGRFTLLY